MQKNIFKFSYLIAQSAQELNEEDQDLVKQCKKAADHAYAPYSKFRVGAALKLVNGDIITGSNQENAAYPSGLCAERVAINNAGHLHKNKPAKTLAICAFTNNNLVRNPAAPCGACRQVIAEYIDRTNSSLRIILVGKNQVLLIEDATDLLPFNFTSEDLFQGL